MSVALMTTVSARTWKIEYPGQIESQAEQCGRICIWFANRTCTHFTHANGICYLKRNENGWQEIDEVGNTCGFIPGRSLQPLFPPN
uniref:Apple domain-containing protein n=1 Tax=Daphnia galeata TaxID=27404 RepID=A0A8J2S0J8_9CRUS|nr:unnamed protein product [Daphnia galeata]